MNGSKGDREPPLHSLPEQEQTQEESRGQLHTRRQNIPLASLEDVHSLPSCSSSFESIKGQVASGMHLCWTYYTKAHKHRCPSKGTHREDTTSVKGHLWPFTRTHPLTSSPEASPGCSLSPARRTTFRAACRGGHFRVLC